MGGRPLFYWLDGQCIDLDNHNDIGNLIASGPAAAIADLLRPIGETLSLDIVRVSLAGSSGINLQIMIEHPDGTPPTMEDCTAFSRAAAAILDEKDPLADAYYTGSQLSRY